MSDTENEKVSFTNDPDTGIYRAPEEETPAKLDPTRKSRGPNKAVTPSEAKEVAKSTQAEFQLPQLVAIVNGQINAAASRGQAGVRVYLPKGVSETLANQVLATYKNTGWKASSLGTYDGEEGIYELIVAERLDDVPRR